MSRRLIAAISATSPSLSFILPTLTVPIPKTVLCSSFLTPPAILPGARLVLSDTWSTVANFSPLVSGIPALVSAPLVDPRDGRCGITFSLNFTNIWVFGDSFTPDALPDATIVIRYGRSLWCKHPLARQRGSWFYVGVFLLLDGLPSPRLNGAPSTPNDVNKSDETYISDMHYPYRGIATVNGKKMRF